MLKTRAAHLHTKCVVIYLARSLSFVRISIRILQTEKEAEMPQTDRYACTQHLLEEAKKKRFLRKSVERKKKSRCVVWFAMTAFALGVCINAQRYTVKVNDSADAMPTFCSFSVGFCFCFGFFGRWHIWSMFCECLRVNAHSISVCACVCASLKRVSEKRTPR